MITNGQILDIIRAAAQTLVTPVTMVEAGVDPAAPARLADLERYAEALQDHANDSPVLPEQWAVDLLGYDEACAGITARLRDITHAVRLVRQAAETIGATQ